MSIGNIQGVYLIFIHFRYQHFGNIVHLAMKFAKYWIFLSIFCTISEIFIPISQPWPQPQSQRQLEAIMTIYTTSCSALTKTTLSTPLFYHHRFYSSILLNFGKLQVSNWKTWFLRRIFFNWYSFSLYLSQHNKVR